MVPSVKPIAPGPVEKQGLLVRGLRWGRLLSSWQQEAQRARRRTHFMGSTFFHQVPRLSILPSPSHGPGWIPSGTLQAVCLLKCLLQGHFYSGDDHALGAVGSLLSVPFPGDISSMSMSPPQPEKSIPNHGILPSSFWCGFKKFPFEAESGCGSRQSLHAACPRGHPHR